EYPYASVMAAGALVTVPLIIMVLAFQRRIVSGLTAGGVKA
ncbi:MAG: carbohydrate ABC transporter permease, partial [Corynebacterium sp.]